MRGFDIGGGDGDLSRFDHPRQLMAWIGVTPSEHSSGGKRRQGSITKTGNSYARKLLIESAWSYRHPARVSVDIQRRHEDQKIRSTDAEVNRLRKRLQSKARHVFMVYETGPCGHGLCRQLIAKGFDCMVCAPSLIPRKPGERVKTSPRRDEASAVRSK